MRQITTERMGPLALRAILSIMLAISTRNRDMVTLLKQAGADLDLESKTGETALELGLKAGIML